MVNDTFKAYDDFFEPISAGLLRLASQRGLQLEKYYHEAPLWSLHFRHPKGGRGKVDICKREDGEVGVVGAWWKDDFDAGTRSIKWFDEEIAECEEGRVCRSAETMLDRILEHPAGAWSKIVDGYKPLWHPYGRRYIEDDESRLQYPRPFKQ